jgi:taurine--2-oxoglutarate transaminase
MSAPSTDSPFFFTWQRQRGATGLQLRGGSGVHFETDEGRFLDLGSLVYQANAGHGQQRIVDAIKAQADELCLSTPQAIYPAKEALARALLAKAPEGFSKVFFTLGGSDANENALKIARLFTGRYKTISRYRSYHGATFGASSLTGDWRRTAVEPAIPGAIHVMDLDDGVEGTQIPRVLELEENVGAVFLEPVVGANGVLIPPEGYFQQIREACDRHGALLVCDEVLTGFGRCGAFFAFERFGAQPDLITCGKAITGGYGTLGAVLVHDRVARFFDDEELVCGLTHYAHPLSVAAALETLRVYEDEGMVANAAALEGPLKDALGKLRGTNARALGLLGGIDVDLDGAGLKALGDALRKRRVHVHIKGPRQLRREHGGAVVVSPPLCITEEELRGGLERVGEAIDEVSE